MINKFGEHECTISLEVGDIYLTYKNGYSHKRKMESVSYSLLFPDGNRVWCTSCYKGGNKLAEKIFSCISDKYEDMDVSNESMLWSIKLSLLLVE